MGLKRAALLLLSITAVGWTTTPKATVAEARDVMAAGGTDGKVARDIAGLKLGERLSENTLAELLGKAPTGDGGGTARSSRQNRISGAADGGAAANAEAGSGNAATDDGAGCGLHVHLHSQIAGFYLHAQHAAVRR